MDLSDAVQAAHLSSLLDPSPFPIAIFEGNLHRLRYGNPSFYRMVDRSEALLGKTAAECLPRCPGCIAVLTQVAATRVAEHHIEEDRDNAWSYSAWPLFHSTDQPVLTLLMITETSEFHRLSTSVNQALLISAVEQHQSAESLTITVQQRDEQLDRTKEELRSLALRLLQVQEEERRRVARELHDSFSQQLAFIGMQIFQLGQADVEASRKHLQQNLQEQISELASQIRRLSHQLHPSALENLGLRHSLRELAESFERTHSLNICIVGEGDAPSHLPMQVTSSLYRITQEALWNVVKHAGAEPCVTIKLTYAPHQLTLIVSDTGAGFDVRQARADRGLGIMSMYERANLIGGNAAVISAPGRGTQVEVRVPYDQGI